MEQEPLGVRLESEEVSEFTFTFLGSILDGVIKAELKRRFG